MMKRSLSHYEPQLFVSLTAFFHLVLCFCIDLSWAVYILIKHSPESVRVYVYIVKNTSRVKI